MQSALIFTEPLNLSTLATSLVYLMILIIIDSISGKLINIRRLRILLGSLVFVTSMSCKLRSSLPMVPLFKEVIGKYRNIVDSKQWKPTDIKENYPGDPLPLTVYNR